MKIKIKLNREINELREQRFICDFARIARSLSFFRLKIVFFLMSALSIKDALSKFNVIQFSFSIALSVCRFMNVLPDVL